LLLWIQASISCKKIRLAAINSRSGASCRNQISIDIVSAVDYLGQIFQRKGSFSSTIGSPAIIQQVGMVLSSLYIADWH